MDVDTFRWLLTDAGQRLLQTATELLVEPQPDHLAIATQLRRDATSAQAAAALTQAELRARAVEKFGADAPRMYFTSEGLEQATRTPVATHRAARIQASGLSTIVDLGCGIGGDLIAFARAGLTAAGVDTCELRATIAQANLEALGLPGAVWVGDATGLDHSTFEVAFADPARRTGAGRTFDINAWSPPWEFVTQLLARDACVRVAPGIAHELIPPSVEAEWVSYRGDLIEAVLWAGRLATTTRRATVLGRTGLATLTDAELIDPITGEVGEFLYEPDPAVIRSHLVMAAAAHIDGWLIDKHLAYVSANSYTPTPFARCYRVLAQLPYRTKPLRAALRERNVGALTIKKRGVEVTPEVLRKQLALNGDEAATIVMTRVDGAGTCLLVEPMP